MAAAENGRAEDPPMTAGNRHPILTGRYRPHRRRYRTALATIAAAVVAAGGTGALSPQPAQAQPTSGAIAAAAGTGAVPLGRGFTLVTEAGGQTLVWSGAKVPIGGARPEFRLGSEVLGYPRETAGGLRLPLSAQDAARASASTANLEVWSAGRRLDAGAPAPSPRRAAPTVPPAGTTPTVRTDPAAPGRYRTERLSYDLAPITLPGYRAPIEMLAEVTRPIGADDRTPLVLLLHGRHGTCFRNGPTGESSGDWPCPAGWAPIPSHLGYRYVTDVLASQGYLAVSISANGINGQDFAALDAGASARSQLIRRHLDLWARWNRSGGDPWGGLFRGKVDLQRVVLVGHSRGGEGVQRAAIDASSADPYRIVGLVGYGPTAFGRQVTPDVTSATLLPTCDGDVSDLQGQAYADASRDVAASPALRSAVIAVGANHNYFNTEWTPGLAVAPSFDDWFDPTDPTCGDAGSVRLGAPEQQKVGSAYTLALVRLSVNREEGMLRLLDGSRVKPAAIGRAETAINAVGGDSTLLYRPEAASVPTLSAGMTGGECLGYLNPSAPVDPAVVKCGGVRPSFDTPHWQPPSAQQARPAPQALQLTWSATGAVARLDLPAAGQDLRGYDSIDLRIANDPDLDPAQLAVRVRDSRGRVDTLATSLTAVEGWPGTGDLDRIQARTDKADLRSARSVDRQRIVAVELVSRNAAGHVWVLDAAAVRARVPRPTPLDLPRVSVDVVTVPEGNGPPVAATVTVRLEERVTAPATVWLQSRVGFGVRVGQALALPAGSAGVVTTVPFSVVGDTLFSQRRRGDVDWAYVSVGAISGAVTGDYLGGVATVEDDPVPTLSANPAAATGVEGGSLHWTLHLSQPTTGLTYFLVAASPGGAELDTDDVDPTWLEQQIGTPPPVPAVPLSQLFGFGLVVVASFDPGATDASVDIPLRADGIAEPAESVRFTVFDTVNPDPTLPPGGVTVTGTVPAN